MPDQQHSQKDSKREIERKFLVTGDDWRRGAEGIEFRQGYLSTEPERTVRVRLEGSSGKLTIKGLKQGAEAPEFEYPIPTADATVLLDQLCRRPLIEKTRYRVPAGGGLVWEIDAFRGDNQGLTIAEIELPSADTRFERPGWIGREVTDEYQYTNARLTLRPYRTWTGEERGE